MEVSCFIPGEENIFTVDIDDIDMTRKAYRLKELIKEKKPITFSDVEADALNLYQVTIEENLEKKPRMEELKRLYKEEKESKVLDEGKPLRKYFVESLPPPGMEYYIMVEIPKGESICQLVMSLRSCYYHGSYPLRDGLGRSHRSHR